MICSLIYHPEYHGVRLDVFAVEDGTRRRFNVELQVKDNMNLPRRSRYYHAQLDMDALFYRYTIANQCEENKEKIADGIHTIWLNTKGQNKDDVPKELVSFLKYVENPDEPKDLDEEDSFVKSLKEQIAAIKNFFFWGRVVCYFCLLYPSYSVTFQVDDLSFITY